MSQRPRRPVDSKSSMLKENGCLNPHPELVTDPLFANSEFFDARDLIQVKYEMVRRVQIDHVPVTQAAASFGFSRPSFYLAKAALERDGIAGLLGKKTGPHRAHKLKPDVLDFLRECRLKSPPISTHELAEQVSRQFDIDLHPRTIERALSPVKKKRQR